MPQAGGIYRIDPPPVQRGPFVPIPAQGDQPPRRTNHLMMGLVLASWPTGLEHQPQQRPLKVAPLTLTYGQQPPSQVGLRDPDILYGSGLWPPLDWAAQRPPQIAPLTLRYGDQPPPYSHVALDVVRRSWEPPDPQPQRDSKNLAPLTLVYGQQPPAVSGFRDPDLLFGAGLWPPPDWPAQVPPRIAPLTLTYGQQPPRRPPTGTVPTGVLAWWQVQDPPRLQAPAFPIAPPVTPTNDPPPSSRAAVLSVLATAWQPPPPEPRQLPRTVAPLTLVYGDQPPRRSGGGLSLVLAAWRADDPVRQRGSAVPPASVDPPPAYSVARVMGLVGAWQVEAVGRPPTAATIAALLARSPFFFQRYVVRKG